MWSVPTAQSFEVVSQLEGIPFEFYIAVVLVDATDEQVKTIESATVSWAAFMGWSRDIDSVMDIATETFDTSPEMWLILDLEARASDRLVRDLELLRDLLEVWNDASFRNATERPIKRLHLWASSPLIEEEFDPPVIPELTPIDIPTIPSAETFHLTARGGPARYTQARAVLDGFDPDRLEELRRLVMAWDIEYDSATTLDFAHVGYPGCPETRLHFVHTGEDAREYFAGLAIHLDMLNSRWREAGGMVLKQMTLRPPP